RRACTKQGEVHPPKTVALKQLDLNLLVFDLQPLAGAACGSKEPQILDREIPPFQRSHHLDANRPGRADDCDCESFAHSTDATKSPTSFVPYPILPAARSLSFSRTVLMTACSIAFAAFDSPRKSSII